MSKQCKYLINKYETYPSPKLKFDSGSKFLLCINAPILFPLPSTGSPLSSNMGVNPDDANDRAQNSPAGRYAFHSY